MNSTHPTNIKGAEKLFIVVRDIINNNNDN